MIQTADGREDGDRQSCRDSSPSDFFYITRETRIYFLPNSKKMFGLIASREFGRLEARTLEASDNHEVCVSCPFCADCPQLPQANHVCRDAAAVHCALRRNKLLRRPRFSAGWLQITVAFVPSRSRRPAHSRQKSAVGFPTIAPHVCRLPTTIQRLSAQREFGREAFHKPFTNL